MGFNRLGCLAYVYYYISGLLLASSSVCTHVYPFLKLYIKPQDELKWKCPLQLLGMVKDYQLL